MENRRSRIEQAYTILSGDDQLDRACKIIPDSFCTSLPLNYVMNIVKGQPRNWQSKSPAPNWFCPGC